MKYLLIVGMLATASVSFANEKAATKRKLSSSESKCSTQLEATARKISVDTGMSRGDTVGLANPTEVNGNNVVVYIGAHASFDRYEFTVSNLDSCSITGLTLSKAE